MADEKNEYDPFAEHRPLTTADIPALTDLINKAKKPAAKKAPAKRSKGGGNK